MVNIYACSKQLPIYTSNRHDATLAVIWSVFFCVPDECKSGIPSPSSSYLCLFACWYSVVSVQTGFIKNSHLPTTSTMAGNDDDDERYEIQTKTVQTQTIEKDNKLEDTKTLSGAG